MTAVDLVATYSIYGLSFNEIVSLVRVPVMAIVIYFTIRIPFKRTYHWMFLVLTIEQLGSALAGVLLYLAPNAATAAEWGLGTFVIFHNRLLSVLVLQFVTYFVSSRVKLWQKLVIVAGYAYVAVTVWLPYAIGDTPPFGYSKVVMGPFGWTSTAGTSDPYLRPDGIDVFSTALAILVFALLFRYYLSVKSPLLRSQTILLALGMGFYLAATLSIGITRLHPNIPNLVPEFSVAGDLTFFLGLRRKGFYSVTPVAETTTAGEPLGYPLQEGRSYLAPEPASSFEAFSELVRGGREGLLITRTFPDSVREDHGIRTTPIRWLAQSKAPNAVPPEDLLGLSLMVKDFLGKAKKPVIMIHGIDYLATFNGFSPVLRLIQGLTEENATKAGILLLPVVPDTLDGREYALLSTETTPMPPAGHDRAN